jgi:hypothetical protein
MKILRRNSSGLLDNQVERNIMKSLFTEPELKPLPDRWADRLPSNPEN